MITNKQLRKVIQNLDFEIEKYNNSKSKSKRDYKEYERNLDKRIYLAIRNYSKIVDLVISKLDTQKSKFGRKSKLTLKQKVLILLIKELIQKSNREMSNFTFLFSLICDIDVSYKTIERLYNDFEVLIVLNNLELKLLDKVEKDELEVSGDATGYSLTITKHYRSEAQILKDKVKNKLKTCYKKKVFIYSFCIMDLETKMILSYGNSFKSENDAYKIALLKLEKLKIKIESFSLDKYYSKQSYVKDLNSKFSGIKTYLIPKSNATIKGCVNWKNMIREFVLNTSSYLEKYFQRENSESLFSVLKKRFLGLIKQKLEYRINVSILVRVIWYNLFRYYA